MSVFTTQGYKFRLVAGSGSYADKTQLDLFADEEIKVSNNITDLFDIGAVPGTFTRTLTLPGTKRNNRFFEQYYDISVEEPDLFQTNQKVEAYIDFDGIYLVTGYLQLQKVSVYENKFVDSYEVNIFGLVSNFTTDAQTYFLTDLDNLTVYNHTSSLANISASWQGNLFDGTIRYALTDSGTGIYYSLNQDFLGIDDAEGALTVQQFKPAIKVKTVWDACFSKLGYTYTSSFFEEPMFDNMYMILNNNLKYPVYTNLELEKYGQFKVTNTTGSNQNLLLTAATYSGFPANSKEYDYSGVATLGSTLQLNIPKASRLTATINLVFAISSSTSPAGSGVPAFYLEYQNANDLSNINTQVLANINSYLNTIKLSRAQTVAQTFELPMDFTIPYLPKDTPVNIRLKYEVNGVNNFTVRLNPPDARIGSSLTVKALNQGADFEILDVPFNMPYGVNGIKIIDFIRGIQKKFNLVMYEDKQVPNQFKVETFNTWYKRGQYQDFNQYINLDQKIEFVPATSLAVNKLNFTDTQDNDFVSTIWQRTYNRTFGQAILIDTGSYFSQGNFDVKTTLAAGPLTSVPGAVFTGSYVSGSTSCTSYRVTNYDKVNAHTITYTACDGSTVNYLLPKYTYVEVCSQNVPVPDSCCSVVVNILGDCTPAPSSGSNSQFPMFIPYYIAGTSNEPARVLPRLFFYNGQLPATRYYIEGYLNDTGSVIPYAYTRYPYFDNYSVVSGSALPTTGSYSLLFNNETPSLGTTPTASLIDTYWQTYLNLLYNPRTRLVNAAAVIPLADYFNMELNDLVQFRSNYYHLRAINDYNLTTGECSIQLLGPIIPDALSNILDFGPLSNITTSGSVITSYFWSGSQGEEINYTSLRVTSGTGSIRISNNSLTNVQALVVGGGGAGGATGQVSQFGIGGGGGAGRLIYSSSLVLETGSLYTMIAGRGGIPSSGTLPAPGELVNGGTSSFSGGTITIASIGGGGGGSRYQATEDQLGGDGGSGGGAAGLGTPGTGSTPGGQNGGRGNTVAGGGGGGFTSAGGAAGSEGGSGGYGSENIPIMEYYNLTTSASVDQNYGFSQYGRSNAVRQLDTKGRKIYAGGGGGGVNNTFGRIGGGAGPGGGGAGGTWWIPSGLSLGGVAGLDGTGGGAGGNGQDSGPSYNNVGGSGTVIVTFPTVVQPPRKPYQYKVAYQIIPGGGGSPVITAGTYDALSTVIYPLSVGVSAPYTTSIFGVSATNNTAGSRSGSIILSYSGSQRGDGGIVNTVGGITYHAFGTGSIGLWQG